MTREERAAQQRRTAERLDILEAIAAGQQRFSEVSEVTSNAGSKREAIAAIGALLAVSDLGARAISELPWHRLTEDSRRQVREECDELRANLRSIEG